jgi:2OG-Fe(II) oxygenase superfamily
MWFFLTVLVIDCVVIKGRAYPLGFGKLVHLIDSVSISRSSPIGASRDGRLFSESVYDKIQQGKIAVIPEFLSKSFVATLKRDAQDLYNTNYFATDALASYGSKGEFDPSKDRTVLRLNQWKNTALGDWDTRRTFGARMKDLRADLAVHLQRPGLTQGVSVTTFGEGSAEISYTRFGPGAFLKRHVDEHHEELKGVAGWSKPTRRSLSWLIYLNEDWNSDQSGGCLRCFERASGKPSHRVGARRNGDLQVGWLRPTLKDPVERPVFLDAQFDENNVESLKNHNCAMYIDSPVSDGPSTSYEISQPYYITQSFNAHPTLFVAGGEFLARKFLVRKDFASRFHFIDPPKSLATDLFSAIQGKTSAHNDELAIDVAPLAGTLVVFDAVALPHQVLPSIGRTRWATSGWMHEDQQKIETHPFYGTDTGM